MSTREAPFGSRDFFSPLVVVSGAQRAQGDGLPTIPARWYAGGKGGLQRAQRRTPMMNQLG